MNQRDRVIIEKIIIYCERIHEYLISYQFEREVFLNTSILQDACAMCLVQIGELSSLLSEDTKQKTSQIPWRIIKDKRDFYVHNYGAVDLDSFWIALNEDVPLLQQQCRDFLQKETIN